MHEGDDQVVPDIPPPRWFGGRQTLRTLFLGTLATGAGVLAGIATKAWWSTGVAAVLVAGVMALFANIAATGYDDWYDDFRGTHRLAVVGAPVAFGITLAAALTAHWVAA